MVDVDRHGSVSLFDTTYSSIKISDGEIVGIDLNTLLRGLINFYSTDSYEEWSGNYSFIMWENILEPSLVCLLSNIATVTEVMTRICYLFKSCEEQLLSIDILNNLKMGSLKFLGHWVIFSDSYFFGGKDLIKLRGMIESMILIDDNMDLKNELNNLKEILYVVCKVRTASNLGIPIPTINTKIERLQQFISRNSDNHVTSMALSIDVKHIAGTIPILGINSKTIPIVNQAIHSEIDELNKKKKILEESIAKSNVEIFGMSTLLDDDDEEDKNFIKTETSTKTINDNNDDNINDESLPIISEDFFLLIDPFIESSDQEPYYLLLTRIHPLEIAKQITIIDHSMFCSIPLHGLSDVASLSNYTQSRHVQQFLDVSLGPSYGGLRRFIDRFNSFSSWVTSTILTRSDSQERGQAISLFIKIGVFLRDLSNFNGLMAVLTALQQAAITRLTLSWEFVTFDELESLRQLKILMSGNKNHQIYRDEVQRLTFFLHNIEEDIAWRGKDNTTAVHATPMNDSNSISAIVPHLGSHLCELTSVIEGNPKIVDQHLFNMRRFRLLTINLLFLRKLQQCRYSFPPVRCVVAALNIAMKRHLRMSTNDQNAFASHMYNFSEIVESPEAIASAAEPEVKDVENDEQDSLNLTQFNENITNIIDNNKINVIESNKNGKNRTAAYDRIKRNSML